jgi:hypothetical protein
LGWVVRIAFLAAVVTVWSLIFGWEHGRTVLAAAAASYVLWTAYDWLRDRRRA